MKKLPYHIFGCCVKISNLNEKGMFFVKNWRFFSISIKSNKLIFRSFNDYKMFIWGPYGEKLTMVEV